MGDTYIVKYRQPGQWFWRKLKGVTGDGLDGSFRFFTLQDDSIVYVSQHAEVKFPPERQALIVKKMSREAGQPIQRA